MWYVCLARVTQPSRLRYYSVAINVFHLIHYNKCSDTSLTLIPGESLNLTVIVQGNLRQWMTIGKETTVNNETQWVNNKTLLLLPRAHWRVQCRSKAQQAGMSEMAKGQIAFLHGKPFRLLTRINFRGSSVDLLRCLFIWWSQLLIKLIINVMDISMALF